MRIINMLFLLTAIPLSTYAAAGQSIDNVWEQVVPPARPAISAVTVASSTTVLLILDIEELTCNVQRRPRCLESVPRIAELAKRARKAGVPVVYSLTSKGTPATILPPVKPEQGEEIVSSSVDKFYRTDLERILKGKGAKTVVVTGTAAHGAVLHTATAAGFRKMQVVLPVDCLSASDLYTEQATVQLLLTGPGTRNGITLTKSDLIEFR